VNIGPITHSRSKKLQQQVTSLLAEINFNIFENFILPKCSTLVVLRFTHEEKNITLHGDDLERSDQPTSEGELQSSEIDSSILFLAVRTTMKNQL
jgi:hypothetical protein